VSPFKKRSFFSIGHAHEEFPLKKKLRTLLAAAFPQFQFESFSLKFFLYFSFSQSKF